MKIYPSFCFVIMYLFFHNLSAVCEAWANKFDLLLGELKEESGIQSSEPSLRYNVEGGNNPIFFMLLTCNSEYGPFDCPSLYV
jgi:hypothetical protein